MDEDEGKQDGAAASVEDIEGPAGQVVQKNRGCGLIDKKHDEGRIQYSENDISSHKKLHSKYWRGKSPLCELFQTDFLRAEASME